MNLRKDHSHGIRYLLCKQLLVCQKRVCGADARMYGKLLSIGQGSNCSNQNLKTPLRFLAARHSLPGVLQAQKSNWGLYALVFLATQIQRKPSFVPRYLNKPSLFAAHPVVDGHAK